MTQATAAPSRRARRPRRGLLVAALVLLAVVGLGVWGLLEARTADAVAPDGSRPGP